MNKLQQFKATFLDSMDVENKDDILKAFEDATSEAKNILDEAISTRDKAKESKRELESKVELVSKELGLNTDFTSDDIKSVLDGKQTDTKKLRDEISAQYEEKYSKDIQALSEKVSDYEVKYNSLNTQHEDLLFSKALKDNGYLSKFIDDPITIDYVTKQAREQMIFKDGKVFVKDSTTGDIATKLGSNDPLDPSTIFENLSKTISPNHLKSEVQANGNNVPLNQARPQGSPADKVDTSKHKDVSSFMNEAFKTIQG